MKFSSIGFTTNDVLKLRAFYEAVFGGTAEGDEIHSCLCLDGIGFVFASADMSKYHPTFGYASAKSSDNITICVDVDDVDAEYQRLLTLDANMLNEPTTHPWGARSFQFKDPDGNILNFRSVPK